MAAGALASAPEPMSASASPASPARPGAPRRSPSGSSSSPSMVRWGAVSGALRFPGDREPRSLQATQAALEMLRRGLLGRRERASRERPAEVRAFVALELEPTATRARLVALVGDARAPACPACAGSGPKGCTSPCASSAPAARSSWPASGPTLRGRRELPAEPRRRLGGLGIFPGPRSARGCCGSASSVDRVDPCVCSRPASGPRWQPASPPSLARFGPTSPSAASGTACPDRRLPELDLGSDAAARFDPLPERA